MFVVTWANVERLNRSAVPRVARDYRELTDRESAIATRLTDEQASITVQRTRVNHQVASQEVSTAP
jgi:hypothetical protein